MNYMSTKKGGKQFETSGNNVVDFFRTSAAQRMSVLQGTDTLISSYELAKSEDPILATKTVFWLRDPRGGAGERAAGLKVLKYLAKTQPEFIEDNIIKIAEYGKWKDLNEIADTHKDSIVRQWAQAIKDGDRLAGKWAPRKGEIARSIRDELGITNKEYRQKLKEISDTVEQLMCEKKWHSIKYDKVPSVAMRKYSKAFKKRDEKRYTDFLNDKTQKVNTSVNYPHEVMKHLHSDIELAEKMWSNLPEFIPEGKHVMPVPDVSGSMQTTIDAAGNTALNVAIALALYVAERNEGIFKNRILTFSSQPSWVIIDPNETLLEKYITLYNSPWSGTTNLQATLDHLLKLTVSSKSLIPQELMPDTLLIMSDMQFDSCTSGKTQLDDIQEKYKKAGYNSPNIVFWNLDAHPGSPGDMRKGVALVSGFSPSILKAILQNTDIDPLSVLKDTVDGYDINFDNFQE